MSDESRCSYISDKEIPIPHDERELEYLVELMEKIPQYKKLLSSLMKDVSHFSNVAASKCIMSSSYQIEMMILRAFFIDLENRKFQAPNKNALLDLRANITHEGLIQGRNITCEVCEENRSVDKCHIIPRKLGGSANHGNILVLCPTHHRLLDRFMLSRSEYGQIDWERKSKASRQFAESVILKGHRFFWKKLRNEKYSPIEAYLTDGLTKPFFEYAANQILEIFSNNRPVRRSNVYKLVDEELKYIAKKALPILIEYNLIQRLKQGKTEILHRPKASPKLGSDLIDKIWQKF